MPSKPLLIVLALLFWSNINAPVFAQKSSSSQKLIAVANYDYTLPSPGFVDSSRVFYSGSRGSKFDFDNLRYDWNNVGDYPPLTDRLPPNENRWGYIQYDSVLTYKSHSFSFYTVTGLRKYDSLGRIIDSRIGSLPSNVKRYLFIYPDSTLRVSEELIYNPSMQKWDTLTYNNYAYTDSNFHLLRINCI